MRYALRMLAKSPGVTIVAVISLALGIGANTAIFSLINALILRPLPVRDPQQLVAIATVRPDSGNTSLSLAMYQDIQKRQQVFSSMFAWSGGGMENLEANGVKYAAAINTVSGEYFSTLGVQPLLGRLISPDDLALDTGFPAPVAVIGYHCWRLRHNSDPGVLGKTILVEGKPVTIIGVTRRTGEIGIRMALGAGRANVLRLISGMLFDLPAADPATIAASAAILSVIALLAGYLWPDTCRPAERPASTQWPPSGNPNGLTRRENLFVLFHTLAPAFLHDSHELANFSERLVFLL